MTTIEEYIAKNGDKPLYSVGPNWVGVDNGGNMMIFPAQSDGWARLKPYRGVVPKLVHSSLEAIGTGYPAWERRL